MNKAAVFIDIAKQYHTITRINREVRIDYKALLDEIKKNNEIHKAYAYGVQIDNESQAFIKMLNHLGYYTRYKFAKFTKEYSIADDILTSYEKPNIQETSWSMGIALDVVRNIGHVNKIIIGSNDIDLIELLYWIREQGCVIELYARNIPRILKDLADKTYDIPISALQIVEQKSKDQENETTKEPESLELPSNELCDGS